MRALGNLIVRLVSVLFGLAMAFLAAAIFLSIGFFNHFIDPMLVEGEIKGTGMITAVLALAWGPFIAGAAFGPAFLLIVVAEFARWRGFITHMLLGAAASIMTFWLHHTRTDGDIVLSDRGLAQGTIIILLSTGFVAGAVYWIFAGRKAGQWLD